MSIEIYDSASRRSPLLEEFRTLVRYRDLIQQLVSRSLKTRYKRSVLGVAWTMLNPLLTMLVLTLVFSTVFRFTVDYYPVYLLSGLVAWNFFSSTTVASMEEMLWSGNLLSRIYVPKSVFAVSAVASGLVNLGISLVPLLIIALITGVKFTPALLVLPASVLILAMFALGIGLLLSTAVVFFADMLPVYQVILTIWMYSTPIFYPIEIIPDRWAHLFKLNPLYHMLAIFREPLWAGAIPSPIHWVVAALTAVVVFVLGGIIFTSKSNEYAYRV
jgi:ABC-type polysaccharide/polyol phosphate export permease